MALTGKTRRSIVMAAILTVVSSVAASAAPRTIGEAGRWRAVEAIRDGQRYCYVISTPTRRTPEGLKRDPGFFFVLTLPRPSGTGTEASVGFGYPVNPTGNVVSVDGEAFVLVTRGETGWLEQTTDEPRLLKAMRAGAEIRVMAQSARGNRTVDTYSLGGFSRALALLQKTCRP